ncbi:putative signal transducing protein [Lysobacter sp. P5_B9]
MKLLCSSTSISFVHSLRIALEGEGIETFCSDSDRVFSGFAGPMLGSASRLYVLHEEDWQRATELLDTMAEPEVAPSKAKVKKVVPRWVSPLLVVLVSAFVVAVLAASQ